MKFKIVSIIMVMMVFSSFFTQTVSAAITKNDLLRLAKKNIASKYLLVAMENSVRTVNINQKQAKELKKLIKEANRVLTIDRGSSADTYPPELIDEVIDIIQRACDVMGYTFKFIDAPHPDHAGDIVFLVYDQNGKLIFRYDGDVEGGYLLPSLKTTDTVDSIYSPESVNSTNYNNSTLLGFSFLGFLFILYALIMLGKKTRYPEYL